MSHKWNELSKKRYLASLSHEMRSDTLHYRAPVRSIYFGGGTPSILKKSEIAHILSLCNISNETEISFECNPEDISAEYLSNLASLGINRISMGVQSLDDKVLKTIGRSGTSRDDILEKIGLIQSYFSTYSVDLIIGLPHTVRGDVRRDIELLTTCYNLLHISVYMLESGIYPKEWKTLSLSDADIANEYMDVICVLQKAGYHHYEVSNWAKLGYECKHNQNYWSHHGYRGYGLSAASLIGDTRRLNSESFAGYYRGEYEDETLTTDGKTLESLLFGFRTFDIEKKIVSPQGLLQAKELGLIEENKGKIMPTSAGILQENHILSLLL